MNTVVKIFLALIMSIFLISCGNNSSGEYGSLTMRATWAVPDQNSQKNSKASLVQLSQAPKGIVTVRVIISGPDMTDLTADFNVNANQGTVDNVPVGTNRTVTMQGLDVGSVVLYQGQTIGIQVQANVVNDAGEIVAQAIEESEPKIQSAAFMLVGEIEDSDQIKAIAARWSKLSVPAQVQLMTALANKGDSAALEAVTDAVKSENSEVKIAALKALASVGDASSVTLLAETAAESRGAQRNAARESLYNISGAGIDDAILQAIEKAKAPVKVELIRSVGQRGIDEAVDILLKTAKDKDKNVQTESLKSLRVIAGQKDIASLVEILKNSSGTAAKEAEKTIIAVGRKAIDKEKYSGVILESLSSARKPEVKTSLLGILGKLGIRQTLPALRKAVNDKNEKVKDAAIRALAEWPDAAAIDDVFEIAKSTANERHKGLALRGYVRMVGMASQKSAGEQAKMYEKAMSLASSAGEKKAVLAGLGDVKSVAALELAAHCLDDKDLQQEAELAVVEIAWSVFEDNPEKTKAVLEKVLSISKNDNAREDAQEILEEISDL